MVTISTATQLEMEMPPPQYTLFFFLIEVQVVEGDQWLRDEHQGGNVQKRKTTLILKQSSVQLAEERPTSCTKEKHRAT